jgi:hypothetical protein
MSGMSKPVIISKEVAGPIKTIEYFFPRIRVGLPDYAGSIRLINGNPPKVIIRKYGAVEVEIEIEKAK